MTKENRVADYLLIGFGAVCIILLSLPLTAKVQSFRWCLSYLLDPVPYYSHVAVSRLAGLPKGAVRLINSDIELAKARERLKETALLEAELAAVREENRRLREAVGIGPPGGRRRRWARVMQRDPLHWNRTIRVAAGSREGVQLNAPVLGLDEGVLGVVGRVSDVGRHSSNVLLLTDELSGVAGQVSERGWEGLLEGQGSARLRMNYLPVEAKIAKGERVLTSPTSASFPPGLFLGRVSKVFPRDPFLAFQSIEVTAAVPAASLKEVMILEPAP